MNQNILIQYFFWHFWEMPKKILRTWKDFLNFSLNYFSTFLLIKTFFSHWHRYSWAYPRGFDIGVYLEVFISNLISRVLGMILRFFLIIIGISVEVFIIFAGAFLFIMWLMLPFLLLSGLQFGFRIIF